MDHSHLDAVQQLEAASSPDPWSRQLLADELEGPQHDRIWFVAEAASVVGFGGVLLIADEAHIMNLVVSPRSRRQGIASQLLAGLLLAAGDRGAIDATLEVRASNTAAVELYHRFGFTAAGRRRRYYPNDEDAIIMWCRKLYQPQRRQQWARLSGDIGGDPASAMTGRAEQGRSDV
jgi:ribosomal-protein-alanine N-acetyltransferase